MTVQEFINLSAMLKLQVSDMAYVKSCMQAVWNEIAYDLLQCVQDSTGATTIMQDEVIECVLDADRLHNYMMRRDTRDKMSPELKAVMSVQYSNPEARQWIHEVARQAFPHARYGM